MCVCVCVCVCVCMLLCDKLNVVFVSIAMCSDEVMW